jgi:glucosyl-dolichyl phosphate glucuronosyltransferase
VTPRISILLCSKDRCEDLGPTLESLAKEIEGRDDVEVFAIDNGSSDKTPELLAEAAKGWGWLKPRRKDIRGKCRALNETLQEVDGEVVAFTDDDVRFEPGWLKQMTEGILSGVCDAAVGCITVPPDRDHPWMSDVHRSLMAATTHYPKTGIGQLVGASMALHRRIFRMVPAFDPELGPGELGYYEDTLFSHQVQQAGFRVVFAADAVVWHHFRLDRLERGAMLKRAFGQGYCEAYGGYHWYHDHRELDWVSREVERLKPEGERLEATFLDTMPPTDDELRLMNAYGSWTYYLVQAQRPPNYRKRGLVRLAPDPRYP